MTNFSNSNNKNPNNNNLFEVSTPSSFFNNLDYISPMEQDSIINNSYYQTQKETQIHIDDCDKFDDGDICESEFVDFEEFQSGLLAVQKTYKPGEYVPDNEKNNQFVDNEAETNYNTEKNLNELDKLVIKYMLGLKDGKNDNELNLEIFQLKNQIVSICRHNQSFQIKQLLNKLEIDKNDDYANRLELFEKAKSLINHIIKEEEKTQTRFTDFNLTEQVLKYHKEAEKSRKLKGVIINFRRALNIAMAAGVGATGIWLASIPEVQKQVETAITELYSPTQEK